MFFKIPVLKNFAIFPGKHLCWSFFLIKFRPRGLQFYYKEDSTQLFSCEYCENFKNTYFEEHLPMAASVISFGHLFLIKNMTWDDFYLVGL